MLFSSLTFIFLFIPLCGLLYYISKPKLKNIILLIFSLLFYSWGEPKYIILMLLTILISWLFGLLINYLDRVKKNRLKTIVFIITILLIISSLLYFKYANFFISNINRLFKTSIAFKNIVLPIGISFYTFQILSYVIDLYRKKIRVQKNIINLSLYISFFPQLIAGPIVRYETIEEQLAKRSESFEKVIEGVERFILGLGKKIIIANNMALIADLIFDNKALGSFSLPVLLLGIVAYTFQIYFDFSGYSDMAIGLGKMFGFEFLENFNYPYMANSISDFWKRWHISLTTFFREYLYIPLGGNRVSKPRWLLNMFIVWLLTGFWHGASWTFIFWGLYYFVLLILERLVLKKVMDHTPKIIRYIITMILVMMGWTLFRASSMSDFLIIIKGLFNINGIGIKEFIISNSNIIPALGYFILAIIFSSNIYYIIKKKYGNSTIYHVVNRLFLIIIFVVCISFLVTSMYNPFIYFRF